MTVNPYRTNTVSMPKMQAKYDETPTGDTDSVKEPIPHFAQSADICCK